MANYIHCSYHKCLTIYFSTVIEKVFRRQYRHFNSDLDDFLAQQEILRIASINNHYIDPSKFPDARITRFIRDPRDLIVSGYYYHKRGAEPWCNIVSPELEDWKVVNGCIPEGMKERRTSYSEYLNELNEENGLLAEMEFRRNHFQSMLEWPTRHERILLYRYEDFLGNEANVFSQICDFFELRWHRRLLVRHFASKYSATRAGKKSSHVRNPTSGQWRSVFTQQVANRFTEMYGDVLKMYGYV